MEVEADGGGAAKYLADGELEQVLDGEPLRRVGEQQHRFVVDEPERAFLRIVGGDVLTGAGALNVRGDLPHHQDRVAGECGCDGVDVEVARRAEQRGVAPSLVRGEQAGSRGSKVARAEALHELRPSGVVDHGRRIVGRHDLSDGMGEIGKAQPLSKGRLDRRAGSVERARPHAAEEPGRVVDDDGGEGRDSPGGGEDGEAARGDTGWLVICRGAFHGARADGVWLSCDGMTGSEK